MRIGRIHLVPFLFLLFLWVFYGYGETTYLMLNKMLALDGLVLIGASLLLGPLARLFPKRLSRFLRHRKALGLWGFAFIVPHVLLSLQLFYSFDFGLLLGAPEGVGIINGAVALLMQFWLLLNAGIFRPSLMAGIISFFFLLIISLTSNAWSERKIGYKKWKALQRASYAAVALALAHMLLMEQTPAGLLLIRPVGIAIFLFALLVLFARAYVLLLGVPEGGKETAGGKAAAAALVLLGIVFALRALNTLDQNLTNWLLALTALIFGLYALCQRR